MPAVATGGSRGGGGADADRVGDVEEENPLRQVWEELAGKLNSRTWSGCLQHGRRRHGFALHRRPGLERPRSKCQGLE